MEDLAIHKGQIIEEAYRRWHPAVVRYLYYETGVWEDAEDLAQDVFVRLADYQEMLQREGVKSFIYTI